jgi:hypothetical protein
MWMNDDVESIFMHNLKCGGCYLRKILSTYNFEIIDMKDIHENYKDFILDEDKIEFDTDIHTTKLLGKYRFCYSHQINIQNKLDNYFLFTFVRNPYDKLYSSYNYLKRLIEKGNGNVLNTPDDKQFYKNFNIFIENHKNVCKRSYAHSFVTQYNTLLNYSNQIKFSYIGRQEALDTDLLNILHILNIDNNTYHSEQIYNNIKCNLSRTSKTIIDDCDYDSFLFINEYFKDDFEMFGYKKYETYEEFKLNFTNDKNNFVKLQNKEIGSLYKESIKLKFYNYIIDNLNSQYKISNPDIDIIKYENCEILKKNSREFKNIEDLILKKNIQICHVCNYKTYNFLSHHVHSNTCKMFNYK